MLITIIKKLSEVIAFVFFSCQRCLVTHLPELYKNKNEANKNNSIICLFSVW